MNVALHKAARSGDLAMLKQMIAEGADINDRGPSKYSPLIAAAIGGDAETVRWLLDNGATVESLNPDDGKNALHYAALCGHVDVVALLLEHGFKSSARDRYRNCTPLHLAVAHASRSTAIETMTLLLKQGETNIEARDKEGMTPLMFALLPGQSENLAFLLDEGANIDALTKTGMTGLMMAAGHLAAPAVVQTLLERGASREKQDASGRTALSFAAWHGHQESVRKLLEYGADIDHRDAAGKTALMYAAGSPPENNWLWVLKKWRDGPSRASRRNTAIAVRARENTDALAEAAWQSRADTVRLLREKGAGLDMRDNDGKTALDMAREQEGGEAVVAALL